MINDALYSLNSFKYHANRNSTDVEGYQWYKIDLKNKSLITIPYGKLDLKKTIIEPLLNKMNNKKVIDLGCDKGYFSWATMKAGASLVVANEIDQDVYAYLKILIQTMKWKKIIPSNKNLFLNKNNKKFDYVLALAMIHEVKKTKLEKIIEKIRDMSIEGAIIEFCEDYQCEFGPDWNHKKFEEILKNNFSNFKLSHTYKAIPKKGLRFIYECYC